MSQDFEDDYGFCEKGLELDNCESVAGSDSSASLTCQKCKPGFFQTFRGTNTLDIELSEPSSGRCIPASATESESFYEAYYVDRDTEDGTGRVRVLIPTSCKFGYYLTKEDFQGDSEIRTICKPVPQNQISFEEIKGCVAYTELIVRNSATLATRDIDNLTVEEDAAQPLQLPDEGKRIGYDCYKKGPDYGQLMHTLSSYPWGYNLVKVNNFWVRYYTNEYVELEGPLIACENGDIAPTGRCVRCNYELGFWAVRSEYDSFSGVVCTNGEITTFSNSMLRVFFVALLSIYFFN